MKENAIDAMNAVDVNVNTPLLRWSASPWPMRTIMQGSRQR